ncbi:MAG: hypothetical protein WCQ86_02670 [Bacteroidaceae bacterium]
MKETDFLQDEQEDARVVEFIQNYLPQELKEKFSEEEIYYFIDVIADYYATSGVLEQTPDKDGFIEIDQEKIVEHIITCAQKEGMGEYESEDLLLVVEAEAEANGEEEEEEGK